MFRSASHAELLQNSRCQGSIIAIIYMEHIEHTAVTAFQTPPSLWLRYVDDTFCILDKEHVTAFHSHLNFICSSTQFTMENEQNSFLSFFDVLVSRKVGNESNTTDIPLTTSIYKKNYSH